MSTKGWIWLGMSIGSTLGGFIPNLWGADFISMSGFICSALGGFLGIWLGYKAGNAL